MKVAQINSVYNHGSTGRIVKDLHCIFQDNKIESRVYYGRGPVSHDKGVIKISNMISVSIDLLQTRILNKHSESNSRNTDLLINELKKFKPDIIHIHNLHGYYLNYEKLFKYFKDSKIPIVWLMHDQWALSGNAAYFDEKKINWSEPDKLYLKQLSREYPRHFFFGNKNIVRVYKRKKEIFDINNIYIVTPSEWLKKVCEESYFNGQNIIVINNGIDLNQFIVNKETKSSKIKNILGVASTWDRRKGIEYFVKLAADLGDDYKITLVGVNKKQKKEIPKSINIIERTESIEELVKLYSEADILVNPTLEDNFPTVNLEAQACGTPVITFDTGGSSESIIDGETGQTVQKENYNELLQGIKKWPKKNKKIQKDCIMNSKKYSKETMLQNYLKMYREILEERK